MSGGGIDLGLVPQGVNGEYRPEDLIPFGPGSLVNNVAGQMFLAMVAEAAADGITISLKGPLSGYRDFAGQQQMLAQHGAYDGPGGNPGGAAPPGSSNHGHGYAFDLVEDPATLAWLQANGGRYGFDDPLSDEPWHWEHMPSSRGITPPAYQGDGSVSDATGASAVLDQQGPDQTPDTYFRNGELMRTEDGTLVLRYQIRPRVFVEYSVSDMEALRRSGYRPREAIAYYDVRDNQYLVNYEEAGDAAEIGELVEAGYRNMRQVVNEAIREKFPSWNAAGKDPEIIAVMARVVANPDAGTSTINSWLNETDYVRNLTDVRQEWNQMTPGQRAWAIDDMAEQVSDIFWDITGQRVAADDERVQRFARRIMRGGLSINQVVSRIEQIAAEDPESPYSRANRNEIQAQGQFNTDVENTVGDLRNQANLWGVELDAGTLTRWSNEIQMNTRSQEDFTEYLKDQAMILYPHKQRDVRTRDWANPWLMTMQRVLEVGETGLSDPRIQQALQNGTTVFEFERQLMGSPEYQQTRGFNDNMNDLLGQMSRQMGFM